MGKIITAFVIMVALVAAYFIFFPSLSNTANQLPQPDSIPEFTQEKQEEEFCIQVVTPARNPSTKEIVEFPTPCDVPEGWEPVVPEGLDLQVI